MPGTAQQLPTEDLRLKYTPPGFSDFTARMLEPQRNPGYGIISAIVSGKLALCSHQDRGHILLDVEGGTPPYTFRWNNGLRVQNRYDLLAGTYTVWIMDSLGYEIRERIVIQPPFPLTLEMAEIQDASCAGGNDGAASVSIKSGRGEPYDIQWSHGLKNSLHANNLAPGTYSVRVSDQFNCSETIYFEIKSQNTPLVLEETIQNASCQNENGSIEVKISGGKAPYDLIWSNGEKGKKIKNLASGQYELLVKDASGCSISAVYQVNDSEPLLLEAEVEEKGDCYDSASGNIHLEISGGTAPYQIEWSHGPKIKTLEDLIPGSYSVTVTDASGCKLAQDFEITGPERMRLEIQTALDIDCEKGEASGTAWVNISGGQAPYSIKWQNGEEGVSEVSIGDDKFLSVEVTDAKGCVSKQELNLDAGEIASMISPSFRFLNLIDEEEKLITVDDPVLFVGEITEEFIAWEWDFGDGTTSNEKDPVHKYKKAGSYEVILKAFTTFGCTAVRAEEVSVNEPGEFLMMPNAFSPNGDGVNDKFRPVTKGVTEMNLDIFNTWGEHLYSNRGRDGEGWDGIVNGKAAPVGNYVYIVKYTTNKGDHFEKTGILSLIR